VDGRLNKFQIGFIDQRKGDREVPGFLSNTEACFFTDLIVSPLANKCCRVQWSRSENGAICKKRRDTVKESCR